VLTGDAGHHKDSLTGKGMTDAFQQAAALAEAVGPDVDDPSRLDAALMRFARRRDELVTDGYRDTLAAAELRPERRLGLMRSIAGDPVMTGRFFSVISGVLPSGELLPAPAR
jgi:2-polyprenyl-6-methoxyphenol hydroxylase-like FAD-dependent oxidoreductase